MKRRATISFIAAVIVTFALVVSVHAEVKPFDAKTFADAQTAGQSIVVHVHAPW